ncbi:hypothetical protein FSP39_010498, partial [Pinctada imbricata]
PIKINITYIFSELGRTRQFCVHNVTEGNTTIQIEIMLGSKFETKECQRCQCTSVGMSCCGIGIYGDGQIFVPDGCNAVADGCRIVLVSDIDNTTDCYTTGAVARDRQGQIMAENSMRNYLATENPSALQMINERQYPPQMGPFASGFGPMGMMGGFGFGNMLGPRGQGQGQGGREPMDGLMEAMVMMSMMGGGGSGGMFGNFMKNPLALGVLATMMS